MLRWTFRNLLSEPAHLLANATAVASAFALVLFFEAVFAGESEQIIAYVERANADVWVMQKGVSNMHMATSFVWDWKADRIAEVDGVSKVTPILYLNTVMRADDRDWFSFIVGMQSDDQRAGPWAMANGKRVPELGEAMVPSVLADLTDLRQGDEIMIAGKAFTIAGLSEGTFSMANSIVFVTLTDLADIMSTFGSVSYILVDAESGIDDKDLAERISSEVDKVSVVPKREFIENDYELAMQMGLEIVNLMAAISGILAILLVSFTAYSSTKRKQRELAVMKALGVRNGAIYASVLVQAGCVTLIGFLIAAALVSVAVPLTSVYLPQVTLSVTSEALLRVGVAVLVVTLFATAIPARSIVKVDPVSAFHG